MNIFYKIVHELDKDIKKLKRDISIYQTHLQKTELWCDNIGKWKTSVKCPDLNSTSSGNSNDSSLLFEIHVELHEDLFEPDSEHDKENLDLTKSDTSNLKEAWVIFKTWKQFQALNENLSELIPLELKIKLKKVPSMLKRNIIGKNKEAEKIQKVTLILDEYLKTVSEDDSLAQSDALYTFLCPSLDYVNKKTDQATNSEEKFSISSIFKSSKSKESTDEDYLDELFSDTDLKSLDSNGRDSIAEPFYFLIEEVFELKGMKKLFQKSLILFVQFTYGATINRKIRESIYWILDDDMLAFYLKQMKDSFWKMNDLDGKMELIKYEANIRNEEEKIQVKKNAKLKLIANIPGVNLINNCIYV